MTSFRWSSHMTGIDTVPLQTQQSDWEREDKQKIKFLNPFNGRTKLLVVMRKPIEVGDYSCNHGEVIRVAWTCDAGDGMPSFYSIPCQKWTEWSWQKEDPGSTRKKLFSKEKVMAHGGECMNGRKTLKQSAPQMRWWKRMVGQTESFICLLPSRLGLCRKVL